MSCLAWTFIHRRFYTALLYGHIKMRLRNIYKKNKKNPTTDRPTCQVCPPVKHVFLFVCFFMALASFITGLYMYLLCPLFSKIRVEGARNERLSTIKVCRRQTKFTFDPIDTVAHIIQMWQMIPGMYLIFWQKQVKFKEGEKKMHVFPQNTHCKHTH